jgi:hypothetical protein
LRQTENGAEKSRTDRKIDLETHPLTGNCSQPELMLTKNHPTDKNLALKTRRITRNAASVENA